MLGAIAPVWHLVAVLLAVLFAWSSIAKALSLSSTREDFEEMGIRSPALAVPLVCAAEASTALLLVVRPRAGAVLALLLLTAFSGVLAAVLRSGRQLRCACFGAVSRRPIDGRDLARNALLLLVAVALLFAT